MLVLTPVGLNGPAGSSKEWLGTSSATAGKAAVKNPKVATGRRRGGAINIV
jgi:hypothetical protein